MENTSASLLLNQKIKVFNFFAFLFFSGMFSLFLYYKILGGVGFKLSSGFFGLLEGGVGIGILSIAVVATAFLSKQVDLRLSKISVFVGLLLLAYAGSQLFIWMGKFNDGLFIGGEVLKSLSVDDILYFTFYYFLSGFHILFALVLGVLFIISGLGKDEERGLNIKTLYKIIKPLYFGGIGLFLLYHVWN